MPHLIPRPDRPVPAALREALRLRLEDAHHAGLATKWLTPEKIARATQLRDDEGIRLAQAFWRLELLNADQIAELVNSPMPESTPTTFTLEGDVIETSGPVAVDGQVVSDRVRLRDGAEVIVDGTVHIYRDEIPPPPTPARIPPLPDYMPKPAAPRRRESWAWGAAVAGALLVSVALLKMASSPTPSRPAPRPTPTPEAPPDPHAQRRTMRHGLGLLPSHFLVVVNDFREVPPRPPLALNVRIPPGDTGPDFAPAIEDVRRRRAEALRVLCPMELDRKIEIIKYTRGVIRDQRRRVLAFTDVPAEGRALDRLLERFGGLGAARLDEAAVDALAVAVACDDFLKRIGAEWEPHACVEAAKLLETKPLTVIDPPGPRDDGVLDGLTENERNTVRQLNDLRGRLGLTPLRAAAELNQAAQAHVATMAARRLLTHLEDDPVVQSPERRAYKFGYRGGVSEAIGRYWVGAWPADDDAMILFGDATDCGAGESEGYWTILVGRP